MAATLKKNTLGQHEINSSFEKNPPKSLQDSISCTNRSCVGVKWPDLFWKIYSHSGPKIFFMVLNTNLRGLIMSENGFYVSWRRQKSWSLILGFSFFQFLLISLLVYDGFFPKTGYATGSLSFRQGWQSSPAQKGKKGNESQKKHKMNFATLEKSPPSVHFSTSFGKYGQIIWA